MKNPLFLLFGLSGVALMPALAMADAFGSSQAGGTLRAVITLTVEAPTCTLEQQTKTVNFGDITPGELRNRTVSRPAGLTISCDSIPAGMNLSLQPVGGSTVDNVATPGVITGSLPGTGYRVTWADGSVIGTKDSPVEYNTVLQLPAARVSDLRLMVTPVATTSGTITSGRSTATINMVLNFS